MILETDDEILISLNVEIISSSTHGKFFLVLLVLFQATVLYL